MDKQLSIIVPMYNVAPYVERCLRSLENQDIPKTDYEVICINDGSPDDSREVIIRLQNEFDNIILIDQENSGVSIARNNGIDNSNGKYILFIDPDDYVDNNTFGRILNNAKMKMSQVSFLGFTFRNEDRTVKKQIFNAKNSSGMYPGIQAYFLARGDGNIDPDRIWAILIEKQLLNSHDLRFLPGVPYLEDGEFIARILCLAERCSFDGHSFYQRTTRPGSATNSRLFSSERATNGFLLAVNNLKNFQQRHDLNEKQKIFLNQPIAKFVLLAVNSSLTWNFIIKLTSTISVLRKSGFSKIDTRGIAMIYKFNGKAYNLSPYLSALSLVISPRILKLHYSFFSRRN